MGAPASRRCAAAASASGWRPRPRAVPMARGGSASARHSTSRCPTPSSPGSASHGTRRSRRIRDVPGPEPPSRGCSEESPSSIYIRRFFGVSFRCRQGVSFECRLTYTNAGPHDPRVATPRGNQPPNFLNPAKQPNPRCSTDGCTHAYRLASAQDHAHTRDDVRRTARPTRLRLDSNGELRSTTRQLKQNERGDNRWSAVAPRLRCHFSRPRRDDRPGITSGVTPPPPVCRRYLAQTWPPRTAPARLCTCQRRFPYARRRSRQSGAKFP